MTKHECAVIMAYTGVTMLAEEDFGIFHKYAEDLLGKPIWTHEFGSEEVALRLKEAAKDEFMEICKNATDK